MGAGLAPPARGRRGQKCQPPPSLCPRRLKGVSHGGSPERIRILWHLRDERGAALHRQVTARVSPLQIGPDDLRPHGGPADAPDGPAAGLRVLRPQGGPLRAGEERVPVAALQPVRDRGGRPAGHDDDGPHHAPSQGRDDGAGESPTPLPPLQLGEEVGPHFPRRVAAAAVRHRWTAARFSVYCFRRPITTRRY